MLAFLSSHPQAAQELLDAMFEHFAVQYAESCSAVHGYKDEQESRWAVR